MVNIRNLLLVGAAAALLLGGLAKAGSPQLVQTPAVSPQYMVKWMSRIMGPQTAEAMYSYCFGAGAIGGTLRSGAGQSGAPWDSYSRPGFPLGGMMGF